VNACYQCGGADLRPQMMISSGLRCAKSQAARRCAKPAGALRLRLVSPESCLGAVTVEIVAGELIQAQERKHAA